MQFVQQFPQFVQQLPQFVQQFLQFIQQFLQRVQSHKQLKHFNLQHSSKIPLYLTNPTVLFSGLVFTLKMFEHNPKNTQLSSLSISTDSVPKSEFIWSYDAKLKLLRYANLLMRSIAQIFQSSLPKFL